MTPKKKLEMYLDKIEEFRIKKPRRDKIFLEDVPVSPKFRNERGFGFQNRLPINNISGGFHKTYLGGIQSEFRKPYPVKQSINPHNCQNARITNTCNCKICGEFIKEFCRETSLHGLKYVGRHDACILERLFWVIAFVVATLTSGYFITIVYTKWVETPVIVSIGAKATQITEIPFPAVTICTMNKVRKSEAQRINSSTSEDYRVYKRMLHETCNSSKSVRPERAPKDNITESWDTILKFMTEVRQPCHEMLLSCFYAGESMNCSDIFNPSLTDEGICCSFNKVQREMIFRNPRDLSDLNVTFPLPVVDWTPEKGYPPNPFKNPIPMRAMGAGTHLGLTVILNAEADEFHCSTSASVGFKLLLHNPVETPKIADYGSLIAPGREYRIKIDPRISYGTNSLYSVKESDRQCAFSSEKFLNFYRTYTQRNCNLECEANYTLQVCKCVPYYLPKDMNTTICGKEEEGCTSYALKLLEMKIMDESAYNGSQWPKPNCNCFPGCNELSYSTTMTYGNMGSDLIHTKGYLDMNKTYNITEIKKNLAVVHLFFTDTQFMNYYKTELFGISEFLSSTGGLLGLFIGFSFISAVEILYFTTVRMWFGLIRGRRKQPPQYGHHIRNNTVMNSYPFVK